jgi:hypothetical protein
LAGEADGTDEVVARVGDKDVPQCINSNAIVIVECRRTADAVGAADRSSSCAAAACERGDDARCGDDGADEVVVVIRDVNDPAVDSDAIRRVECCRAADAVSVASSSPSRTATPRERCDGTGRKDNGADEVVIAIAHVEHACAVESDASREVKGGCAADAVGAAARSPARTAATCYCSDDARCHNNRADEVVHTIADVQYALVTEGKTVR